MRWYTIYVGPTIGDREYERLLHESLFLAWVYICQLESWECSSYQYDQVMSQNINFDLIERRIAIVEIAGTEEIYHPLLLLPLLLTKVCLLLKLRTDSRKAIYLYSYIPKRRNACGVRPSPTNRKIKAAVLEIISQHTALHLISKSWEFNMGSFRCPDQLYKREINQSRIHCLHFNFSLPFQKYHNPKGHKIQFTMTSLKRSRRSTNS